MKKARNSTLTHLSALCACFINFWCQTMHLGAKIAQKINFWWNYDHSKKKNMLLAQKLMELAHSEAYLLILWQEIYLVENRNVWNSPLNQITSNPFWNFAYVGCKCHPRCPVCTTTTNSWRVSDQFFIQFYGMQ